MKYHVMSSDRSFQSLGMLMVKYLTILQYWHNYLCSSELLSIVIFLITDTVSRTTCMTLKRSCIVKTITNQPILLNKWVKHTDILKGCTDKEVNQKLIEHPDGFLMKWQMCASKLKGVSHCLPRFYPVWQNFPSIVTGVSLLCPVMLDCRSGFT